MRKIARRAALIGTLAVGLLSRKPLAEEAETPGKLKLIDPPVPAPAISFLDADGASHSLKDYRGSGVVLNLWATWCAPCVAELPSLDALAGKLAGQGVVVLALSSDHGGAAAVRRFYQEHGIKTLPILLDPQGTAMRAFGLNGIPATFLLDAEGQERAREEGGEDWAKSGMVERITTLLKPGLR